MAEYYSIRCMCHISFINSSVDEHLDFIPCLVFEYAAMNKGVHVTAWYAYFLSIANIPSSETAGCYDDSIFKYLRNFQTIFCNGLTNLQ